MIRPLLAFSLLSAVACSSAPNAPELASWTGTTVPGEARACCVALAESACGSATSDVVVASTAGLPYDEGCDGGQTCNAYEVPDGEAPMPIVVLGTCQPDTTAPEIAHGVPAGRR